MSAPPDLLKQNTDELVIEELSQIDSDLPMPVIESDYENENTIDHQSVDGRMSSPLDKKETPNFRSWQSTKKLDPASSFKPGNSMIDEDSEDESSPEHSFMKEEFKGGDTPHNEEP